MNTDKSVKTILVVEDEAIISIITSKALKRFGYEVVPVNSGEKAVEAATEHMDLSLILMDINLGEGIDGTEAARQILSARDIPIVFHTSHSEREMVEKVRGITRYGYVVKSSGDFVLQSSIEMAFELFEANRNTEKIMNAMAESEEKYRAAFMTSPDAVNINKMNGLYVDINDGFTKLTGYTREEVIGVLSSEISIWARPEDRVKLIKGLTETGSVENLESLFRCKDGSFKTALMSARVIKLKNEPHILSITRDITDRKEYEIALKTKNEELNAAMEEMEAANEELFAANEELIATNDELAATSAKLQTNENRFRSVVEKSHVGVAIVNDSLKYTYVNEEFCNMAGYEENEIIGQDFTFLLAEESKELSLERYRSRQRGEDVPSHYEFSFIRKNGEKRIGDVRSAVYLDSYGKVNSVIQTIDITERKQKEAELKEISDKFLAVASSIPGYIAYVNADTLKYEFINEAYEKSFGLPREKIIGSYVKDIIGEKSYQVAIKYINEVKEGKYISYENSFEMVTGRHWLQINYTPVFDQDGNVASIAVFNYDITERKMAEQALKESEAKFRSIFDQSPIGSVIVDLDRKFVRCNSAFCDFIGCTESELIGKSISDITYPDDLELGMDELNQMAAGQLESSTLQKRYLRKDGSIVWGEITICIVRDAENKPLYFLPVIQDITGRKLGETALRESETRYREIVDLAVDGILLGNHDGIITDANESMCRISGLPKGDLVGKHITKLPFTPESLKKSPFRFDLLQNGEIIINERVLTRPDGSEVVVEMHSRMMPDGSYQSIYRDITARKQAESNLVVSEARFSALMDNFPGMVLIKDAEFRPVYVNRRFRELFPADEWIGKTPEECFTPDVSIPMRENDKRALAGESVQYDEEWQSAEGITRVLETRKFRIELPDDTPLIGTFILDITRRKQAEEKIKKLLKEKEIILREVHHRIKNNMNTINSLLTLQADNIKDPSAIAALEDAGSRVHSMMVLYDKLYQSVDFQEISIKEYLPALLDEIIVNFSGNRLVKIEKKIDDFVIDAKKLQPLGIIINELLTNIMKHAFSGIDSGLITVIVKISDKHATITVHDNGIGIPETIDFKSQTGFGLQLVDMLVEQLEGSIRIERGYGTRFVLEFDV